MTTTFPAPLLPPPSEHSTRVRATLRGNLAPRFPRLAALAVHAAYESARTSRHVLEDAAHALLMQTSGVALVGRCNPELAKLAAKACGVVDHKIGTLPVAAGGAL